MSFSGTVRVGEIDLTQATRARVARVAAVVERDCAALVASLPERTSRQLPVDLSERVSAGLLDHQTARRHYELEFNVHAEASLASVYA